MLSLIGEYEIAVDAKGRFPLPSGFRKQLPAEEGNQFVLTKGFEKCLVLYPIASWNLQMGQIEQLNPFNPKVRELKRLMYNGASPVESDGSDRLLINKNLKEYANLTKEITFCAQGDRVEIWDRATYQQYLAEHSENLSALAEEVAGGEYMNPFLNPEAK